MAKFTVKSVIVCDELRREIGGKEILIGVYGESIIFPTIPAVMERIHFRLVITCEPSFSGDFSFSFGLPGEPSAIEFTSSAPAADRNQRMFGFVSHNLMISVAGQYEIRFGLGSKARTIETIEIRTPKSDAEAAIFKPA